MKKLISSLLVCLMVFSCCGSALAAGIEPYASITLRTAQAAASTGVNSGEIKISYQARTNKAGSPVGVSSIAIYKSDGTYVTTIKGSTSNGLMANGTLSKSGSYTYRGSSGTSYYAKVTIAATAGSEYDSRTITTNVARAK